MMKNIQIYQYEQFHSNIKQRKSSSCIIHFGLKQYSGNEFWDTSEFLRYLFQLFDEYKTDESRLAAYLIYHLNEIQFNHPLSNKIIIQILNYFKNIRLKILVFIELLTVSESIDCCQALILLWQFSNYGYMILFYVLDRIKFRIIDKDLQWKSLLTIFEPLENKKHAAYIILDKTNFYKPNRAIILFGTKRFTRFF